MNDQRDTLNPVYYGEKGYLQLNSFLTGKQYSRIFVLVDTNTHQNCLSVFLKQLETELEIEVIEMEAGEENKHLQTCEGIWNTLSELGADRKSLMINVGGGVVTDLGGFVACTFKRGIDFINVPTTLLSMVDASIGGKTGVDLGNLKNQIGVIEQPEMVIVDAGYLATLPAREMRSGLAEILKHGLIADENYWEKISNLRSLDINDLPAIIENSVSIKAEIVKQDPFEKGLRKVLNFGHTLGHAIESYMLTHPKREKLLHGEAIVIGMILESYISMNLLNFPEEKLNAITKVIKELYGSIDFSEAEIEQIKNLLIYDKKNEHGKINFVLLKDIGKPEIDCEVISDLIDSSFKYYLNN